MRLEGHCLLLLFEGSLLHLLRKGRLIGFNLPAIGCAKEVINWLVIVDAIKRCCESLRNIIGNIIILRPLMRMMSNDGGILKLD
jgi:hypothetical protein